MRSDLSGASPSMWQSRCSGGALARPLAAALTIGVTVLGMTVLAPQANAGVATKTVAATRFAVAAAPAPIAPVTAGSSAASLPIVQPVTTGLSEFDLQVLDALNVHRTAGKLAPLVEAKGLDSLSAAWSTSMPGAATLQHNPNAWDQLITSGAAGRTAFGEDVASWTDSTVTADAVVDRYLTNASNAANINDPALKFVGISTQTAAGTKWNTLTFVDAVDAGTTYDPALRSVPVGQLTSASVTGATVRVTGWGFDRDTAGAAIEVSITDKAPDGTVSTSTTSTTATSAAGADVPAGFAAAGARNFAAVSNIAGRGVHQLCARVSNAGAGITDTDLGCLPVQVGGLLGALDDVSAVGTKVTVSGWSVDYDKPQSPMNVSITDNGPAGATVTTLPADRADARVDSAVPGVGAGHGFSKDLTATGVGSHSICVTGTSVDGTLTKSLGCRTVNVVVPVGALVGTTNNVTSITANGWAVDPGTVAAPSSVELTLSGPTGAVGAPVVVTANASTTASLAKYPTGGSNHGFSTTWQIPSIGTYQVCATARSLPGATATTSLGCRAVVVSSPLGWLDAVVLSKGAIVVKGWALDSVNKTAVATPTMTITGVSRATMTVPVKADTLRANIGRAYPGAGNNHGYTASIATGSGARTVCMTMKAMTDSTIREFRCVNVIVP